MTSRTAWIFSVFVDHKSLENRLGLRKQAAGVYHKDDMCGCAKGLSYILSNFKENIYLQTLLIPGMPIPKTKTLLWKTDSDL